MKEVAEIAGFILEEMCVQFTECTLQALYLQYQEENNRRSAGLPDKKAVMCVVTAPSRGNSKNGSHLENTLGFILPIFTERGLTCHAPLNVPVYFL